MTGIQPGQILLQSLEAALREHPEQEWKDRLSYELRYWTTKTALCIGEGSQERLTMRVAKLLSKVLANPLLPSAPLRNPIVERGWVWEQSLFDDYSSLINLSPFDGQPMERPRPHELAKQFLVAVRLYLDQSNQSSTSTSHQLVPVTGQLILLDEPTQKEKVLTVRTELAESLIIKMGVYISLAREFITRIHMRVVKIELAKTSKLCQDATGRVKVSSEKSKESLTQSQQQHEKQIAASTAHLQTIHSLQAAALLQTKKMLEQSVSGLTKKVELEMQQKAALEQESARLRREIGNLH